MAKKAKSLKTVQTVVARINPIASPQLPETDLLHTKQITKTKQHADEVTPFSGSFGYKLDYMKW